MSLVWFVLLLFVSSFVVKFAFSLVMMPVIGVTAGAMWVSRAVPLLGRTAVHAAMLFALGVQVYFWAFWGANCASVAASWSVGSSVPWLYYAAAFGASTSPVAWFAHKEMATARSTGEQQSIMRGTVLYGTVAVAAYVVFAVWPAARVAVYGWIVG